MTSDATVPGVLAARAGQQPDRIALQQDPGESLTFAGWHRRARAVAGGLAARGLRRGDRVVLHLGSRDWLDFAVAYCGVQQAGGVAVPSSDRLAPAQTRHVVEHCEARLAVHSTRAQAPDAGVPAVTVAELEDAGAPPPDVDVRPSDLAQILYTSGTTGTPKGVAATHANLTVAALRDPRHRRLAHSEHFLFAFPIGTNAAQTMLLTALDAHPTGLVAPQFTPGRFARLIESRRVGTVFVVPAMAIELLASGALERHDLTGVQLLGSTAAPLPPHVAAQLARHLPQATIVNYYTSTEAAPAQVSMVFDPRRPAALGRAVGGTVAVRDDDGQAVPPGTTGEVWLRSPFPRTYYRDTAASGRTFAGGWVRMGDLGFLDRDGYLHLVDREQDVVKSGADKVSTVAVEAAVHEHAGIAEAAVFGVPHPVLGTAVVAAVVPRPGTASPTLPELRGFLTGRLAAHELPMHVLTLDRLPRNDGGKVLKNRLRELFAVGADTGATSPSSPTSTDTHDRTGLTEGKRT